MGASHAVGVWTRHVARCAALVAGLSAPSAWALDYLNVTIEQDRAVPSACFSLSAGLLRGKPDALEPYVAIEPKTDHSLQVRGKDLCVNGLRHGQAYTITLKAGLPGADGTALAKSASVAVTVPDRDRQVSFDQGKTLLPFTKGVGLPLKSVNVAQAHLALYRFGDRGLVDQLVNDWFGTAVSGYTLETIADRSTKVFEGTLAVASVPNKQVTTAIPLDGLVKGLQPGVYVATATPGGQMPDQETERATQWFSISDIGLVTVKSSGGLLVSARSLQSATPIGGVELRLLSQANEVLGAYKTDGQGRFTIPAGLLRGEHGDAPKVLAAVGADGQFTWLQLDAPALDLSEFDIKGRAPPETNDVFLWTDRGVYRPGETIHVGALLRDRAARAVAGTALTMHIVRPDAIEVQKRQLDLASASGGSFDFPVPDNATSGTWRIWASAGDNREVGTTSVSVQDFVPPRLEAKLSAPPGPLSGLAAIEATVAADYFYGSPGSGLTGQVEATVQPADRPFKGLEGFSFGLVQEPFLPQALQAQDFTTDDKGRAAVVFPLEAAPDTTVPLQVAMRARVNDVDGRPAQVDLTKALHTADRFIGLRARTPEGLGDGAEAAFDVVMVDGDGAPVGASEVKWDLVKEDYQYTYFYRDGRWQSKETLTDARVNGGEQALGADGRGTIAARVTSGRWRLEAYDAAGKVATSLRFGAGWWAGGQPDRKPEVMAVTLDAHPPAGIVRAMVEPSFAGRVLVMLDGGGLHGVQEREMPKGGGAVEFDAADVPPSGAYLLAVAVSPAGAVLPRLPVRAVGLAWVPGATATHTLDVALQVPDVVRPKTRLAVNVAVAGAGAGERAFVTLAAVDEAVLRMTDFATPDPADHFLGRREPGFELRDVYGALIDPSGQPGQLRQGGDGNANAKAVGLDVKTFKTVALFQGPVQLDAAGHATLGVDVPEFSGRLRLMAVAWTADRFGRAERPVTVRPPLLAELALPRFLAPGDRAVARLMLTDLDAPEQTYTVAVTTEGAVSLDRADASFKDVKRERRRFVDRVLTAAAVPGVGRIHLTATGEDGGVTERDFEITVRTPNAYATDRQIVTLAPGQHLVADDALGAGLVPGTGTLAITASVLPAFDVPGLLASLRTYPYGCAEQTISRAFPELFAKALGSTPAAPVADTVTAQGAIQRLFSLQSSDGSFGYWSAFDAGNLWLTAYAVDFLQHARAQGLSVPDTMESRATAWLAGHFGTLTTDPQAIAGAAYTAIVLARANKLDLSQLRYVATRAGDRLPSDIARFQFAAALTRVGERDLALRLVEAAPVVRDPKTYLNDYGSPLRDRAMALSLAAEEGLVSQKVLFSQATDLARLASGKGWLSTQEQAWLLRTAFDLKPDSPLQVDLDGRGTTGSATSLTAALPLGRGRRSDLMNRGRSPVYVSLGATGIPTGVPPAEAMGFSVKRSYFTLAGAPADLADVHQNDEMVVVVEGTMADALERKVLAVDMLPAGLEPETVGLSGDRDAGRFAWLKDLTDPTFTQLRDDRYLAGLNLSGADARFKFAYLVRAVTPGSYARPGPQVEDMYAPTYHARGEAGTLEVKPPRKLADDTKTTPAKPTPAKTAPTKTAPGKP